MGGKIFSEPQGNQPALMTPRMSEAVYTRTRDFCIQQLQYFFEIAVAPAEAPGKIDYGDVDILVQGPRSGFTWEEVGSFLKACRTVKSGQSRSFAIPIDHYYDNNNNDANGDSDTGTDKIYAQIDVNLCQPGFVEWECLLASYGDMWQIIGRVLRPLGLTATNKGLHARISEIEPWNRAHSMLYLTHNVTDVLGFLDLDMEKYQRGFKSLEELYNWCADGKYFHFDAFKHKEETANDRQRMKKRAMFRSFHDEWIPQNAHLWKDKELVTREDVTEQALVRFGKQVEYGKKITEWRLLREEEQLWKEVAGVVSEHCSGGSVNMVVRGLKRWVYFRTEDDNKPAQPALRVKIEMDPDYQPRWASQISHGEGRHSLLKSSLFEWVRKVWPEVKELEKERVAIAKEARS